MPEQSNERLLVVQTTRKRDTSSDSVKYKYTASDIDCQTTGQAVLRFSSNMRKIEPVDFDTVTAKPAIQRVKFGKDVKVVEEGAFQECSCLTDVEGGTGLKKIQAYAFEGCTGLSSFAPFNQKYNYSANPEKFLYKIGEYAFASTDLRVANINIVGAYADFENPDEPTAYGEIGKRAFAGCSSLTDVNMSYGTYLAESMFEDCTALKHINFINRHGFLNNYVFKNCTSLESFNYPGDFLAVSKGMFSGCSALTSIQFGEPNLKKLNAQAFEGCTNLTSITLPASISSFSQIDKNFLLGSNIKQITFKGIESDRISDSAIDSNSYIFNKLYTSASREALLNAVVSGSGKNSIRVSDKLEQAGLDIDDFMEYTTPAGIIDMFSYCVENNIPLISFSSNLIQGCYNCKCFFGNDFFTKNTLDYLNAPTTPRFIGLLEERDTDNDSLCKYYYKKYLNYPVDPKTKKTAMPGYVIMFIYLNNGGQIYGGLTTDSFNETVKPAIEKHFKVSTGDQPQHTTININIGIIKTSCFGAYKDVVLVGADGRSSTYNNKAQYIEMSLQYSPMIQVDYDTIKDFKYGIWYYNAKQLKEYADKHNIPVFVQLGSKGCPPCEEFTEVIFKNSDFQNFVKNSCYIFCRVVSKSTTETQPGYILNNWSTSKNIPQIMCYWKKPDGTVFKEARYFGGTVSKGPDGTYSANYSVEQITAWMAESFAGYVPQDRFKKPTITDTYSAVSRYRKYDNIVDDDNGMYYVCAEKTYNSTETYELSVGGAKYSIRTGLQTQIPAGTYQYFPMLSADDTYEDTFDISGVIFKSGLPHESKFRDIPTETPTIDEYNNTLKTMYGVAGDVLSNCVDTDYNYTIYATDSAGDYLNPPQIDSDIAASDRYNCVKTYRFDPIRMNGHDIDEIKLYAMCDAVLDEDLDIDVDDSTAKVLTAEYYGYSEPRKILYIYDFSNISEE